MGYMGYIVLIVVEDARACSGASSRYFGKNNIKLAGDKFPQHEYCSIHALSLAPLQSVARASQSNCLILLSKEAREDI